MNQNHYPFIRYYRAPVLLAAGRGRMEKMGTWYGEYDGIFTVREFVVRSDAHVADDRVAVAPFDMPFREPGHPMEPPTLTDIVPISLQEFESLWEQFVQPRLHALAVARPALANDGSIRYFRSPSPAEFNPPEAASDIYTEYAAGVARRSFEVFADYTLVASYDVVIPEVSIDDMLLAAHEGRLAEGDLIDLRLRPQEVSHAVFEALWEQWAIPRFRVLAELPPSTRHS